MFALSVDIMGPFEPGSDADHHLSTKKYAVVGAYSLPILREGELVTRERVDEPIRQIGGSAPTWMIRHRERMTPCVSDEQPRHQRVQAYIDSVL